MRLTVQVDLFPEVGVEPDDCPDERYTPRWLFDPLDKEFSFTLDVCATAESAKCECFFTQKQDGLKQPWGKGERVWCNPPYSDIRPWVEKAWSSSARVVVMLLPAWTDREWWADLVEPYRDKTPPVCGPNGALLTTRFLPGRVRFGLPGNPEGHGSGSPPFWCCLLIFERL